MRKVFGRLYVGTDKDCFHLRPDWSVVHACKFPCHKEAAGYLDKISQDHPNYLFKEEMNNLYLNIVDAKIPLFMLQTFIKFLEFTERMYAQKKEILIHCNEGQSRSTSLALLFLAKRLSAIPNDSYDSALEAYYKLDPFAHPGEGISKYLRYNWNSIL